jgi:hypothetical protein
LDNTGFNQGQYLGCAVLNWLPAPELRLGRQGCLEVENGQLRLLGINGCYMRIGEEVFGVEAVEQVV